MIPNVRDTLNSADENCADIKGNQALFPSIAKPAKRHRAKIMTLRDRFEVENGTQNTDHAEAAQRAALKGDRALLRLLEDDAWQSSQTNQYPRCSICADELPFSFYHCYSCKDDKFDLCEKCYMDGKWCLDLNHRLLRTPPLTKPRSFRAPGEKYYSGEDGNMLSFITNARSPAGSRNCAVSIRSKESKDFKHEPLDTTPKRVLPEFGSLAEAAIAAVSNRSTACKEVTHESAGGDLHVIDNTAHPPVVPKITSPVIPVTITIPEIRMPFQEK